MKSNTAFRKAIQYYKENELIFASKVYKESMSKDISEVAYYKMLERMYKDGELAKAARGIYYKPKSSKYGIIPPSQEQIIESFTKNNTGTVIGYALYNRLNLTTQVAKTVQVLSSTLDGFTKTIRNVSIKQVELEFTQDVEDMIQGLDVLQNFYEIEDINYLAFLKYCNTLAEYYREDVFEKVISKVSYKKSTIAFLREILCYYNVQNTLYKYLSALSNYKYPRMEELHELAQTFRGI